MIRAKLRAKLYLPNPEKGEHIELILRRHTLIMFAEILFYAVLLIVPWVLRWFLMEHFSIIWNDPFWHSVLYLGGSIYILDVTLFFFTSFIDYWLDVWIITNERIISIEQKGIFARAFAEQKLYRLQDITSTIEGFLPTVFHYGDVVAQSAGAEQNAVMKQIPGADIVARKIMDLVENSKKHHKE